MQAGGRHVDRHIDIRVRSGDGLAGVLQRMGLTDDEINAAIDELDHRDLLDGSAIAGIKKTDRGVVLFENTGVIDAEGQPVVRFNPPAIEAVRDILSQHWHDKDPRDYGYYNETIRNVVEDAVAAGEDSPATQEASSNQAADTQGSLYIHHEDDAAGDNGTRISVRQASAQLPDAAAPVAHEALELAGSGAVAIGRPAHVDQHHIMDLVQKPEVAANAPYADALPDDRPKVGGQEQHASSDFSLEQAVQAIDEHPLMGGDDRRISNGQEAGEHSTEWYSAMSEEQKANYRTFGDANGPVVGTIGHMDTEMRDAHAPGYPMQPQSSNAQVMEVDASRPPMQPVANTGAPGVAKSDLVGMQMIDPATGQWTGEYVDRAGNRYQPVPSSVPGQPQVYMDDHGNQFVPMETEMASGATGQDTYDQPRYQLQDTGFSGQSASSDMTGMPNFQG